MHGAPGYRQAFDSTLSARASRLITVSIRQLFDSLVPRRVHITTFLMRLAQKIGYLGFRASSATAELRSADFSSSALVKTVGD
jgi:hypothetical protein